MQFSALLIALSLTGSASSEAMAQPPSEPDPNTIDLCELGRQIARLEPCIDAKSCEALQIWKDLFGAPSADFATPGDLPRDRRGWATAVRGDPRERSFSYRELMRTRHCWARVGGSAGLARP